MNAKIPLSSRVEFPLKVPVLWIIRRMVSYDKNRLKGAQNKTKTKVLITHTTLRIPEAII